MLSPLPPIQHVSGVLSFDFDGTLDDPLAAPRVEPLFFEVIEYLRSQGYAWGINTGRSQMQMTSGFTEGEFPFLPDFLIAREREIYTPGGFGRWHALADWNKKSEKEHQKMFRKSNKLIQQVRKYVEQETSAQWVSEEGDPAGVVATSIEEMDKIVQLVESVCTKSKTLGFLRNTIYMRFSHRNYHKGSSLAEVARRYNVAKKNVFAIGDGENDLDMLDRNVAEMIACPANSNPLVKEHVLKQGGYVCDLNTSAGVIEAMQEFLNLPE